METYKTISEILVAYNTHEVDSDGYITLKFDMLNPLCYAARLDYLQYYKDSAWHNCTLITSQGEDQTNIPLHGKTRTVSFVWDAATDFGITEAFSSVLMKARFYDRTSGGTASEVVEFTLSSIDFTQDYYAYVNKPVPSNTAYMQFGYFTNVMIRPALIHFEIEIDQQGDWEGEDYDKFDSDDSQTNWTYDGDAYPSAGIDNDLVYLVEYENSALESLESGVWHFRIKATIKTSKISEMLVDDDNNPLVADDGKEFIIDG